MKCKTPNCPKPTCHGHKFCSRCRMRKWRKEHPIEASYQHIKGHAKRRGRAFNLTLDDFRTWATACNFHLNEHGKLAHCISVDRIDHTKPYQIGNIQPLTISENSKKWHHFDKHQNQTEITTDPF